MFDDPRSIIRSTIEQIDSKRYNDLYFKNPRYNKFKTKPVKTKSKLKNKNNNIIFISEEEFNDKYKKIKPFDIIKEKIISSYNYEKNIKG